MRTFSLAVCAALVSMSSPSAAQTPELISLSEQQIDRLDIRVDTARPIERVRVADFTARAVPAVTGLSAVIAPHAGTVRQVNVLPGQTVRRGDPLFELFSRDFTEDRSGLAQAEAEYRAAKAALARQKLLVEEGIAALSSLEAATAREETALAMVREHQRAAPSHIRGAADGGYIVRAPDDGTLVSVNVTLGQRVEAMTSIASVNRTGNLWAEIQIPVRRLSTVRIADAIQFQGGSVGQIISVSENIDPITRAGLIIAEIPSKEEIRPGQVMTVSLVRDETETDVVEVPASAIVRVDDQDAVFTKEDKGFRIQPVTLRGGTTDVKIIQAPIRAGTQVAISGLVELKALALKGAE